MWLGGGETLPCQGPGGREDAGGRREPLGQGGGGPLVGEKFEVWGLGAS